MDSRVLRRGNLKFKSPEVSDFSSPEFGNPFCWRPPPQNQKNQKTLSKTKKTKKKQRFCDFSEPTPSPKPNYSTEVPHIIFSNNLLPNHMLKRDFFSCSLCSSAPPVKPRPPPRPRGSPAPWHPGAPAFGPPAPWLRGPLATWPIGGPGHPVTVLLIVLLIILLIVLLIVLPILLLTILLIVLLLLTILLIVLLI